MNQIARRVIDRKGRVIVIELPAPHLGPNKVLIQNAYSLLSSGTELSTLSKTPIQLVKQTLSDPWMRHVVKHTIFATGPAQTARRVWAELVMPREIGYSGAGKVVAVGSAVDGLRIGETVAYASRGHAEIVAPSIFGQFSRPTEGAGLLAVARRSHSEIASAAAGASEKRVR